MDTTSTSLLAAFANQNHDDNELDASAASDGRWLILDMELSVGYNESAHEVVVHFDEDPDAPTVKYSWLEYTVFALLVPFAFMLVALCFFLSKRHERHNRAKREAERLAQFDHLRDKIQCKPWCHPDEQTRAFDRSVLYGSSKFVGNSTNKSPFAFEDKNGQQRTLCPDPPVGGVSGFTKAHNGFYCVICLQPFSLGEPVYNSNNPDCRHQIHLKCMNSDDGWMSHQNICPVCTHPFVVLRPHEGDWISNAFSTRRTGSSTIRNVWRSIRGSDNHRKEMASIIARSTLDYPAKILEENSDDLLKDSGSSGAGAGGVLSTKSSALTTTTTTTMTTTIAEDSEEHRAVQLQEQESPGVEQPKEGGRNGGADSGATAGAVDLEQGQQTNGSGSGNDNDNKPPMSNSVMSI